MNDALIAVFGVGKELTALQMCARAIVVFALTLAAVRAAGRRSLGAHTTFGFIVSILVGAIASRAITGASPFAPTLCAVFALVLTHRAVGWLCVICPPLDVFINGRDRVLAEGGVPHRDEMRKALVSRLDLEEAARLHGHAEASQAGRIRLERNGKISAVKGAPEPGPQRR